MKSAKDIICLVADAGLFVHVARRLAREFKTVYYWSPWENAFPHFRDDIIGDGYSEIIRVESVESVASEIDLAVFPDIGYSDLQKQFIERGIPVWGCRNADELEARRGKFLDVLKNKTNLPVPKAKKIKGITNLRLFLQDNPDQYIKVDTYRGDFETFHFRSMEEDENIIDEMAAKLGPLKENLVFWVFAPIDTQIEDGIDTYCIDGQWPETIIHGMEAKDCYDEKTEVMTDCGWKLFKDLDGSEEMLTLNISNPRWYKLEYQKPTTYIRDNYAGKMLSLESDNYSLLVTPNHKLLMQVNSQNPNAEVVEWSGVDGIKRKFHKGRHNRKLVAAKSVDFSKWQSMPWPRSALFSGRSTTKQHFSFNGVKFGRKQFARFLGIYLSEGWTNGKRIIVAQSKYFPEMEGVLKDCKLKYSTVRHHGMKIGFEISNRPLAKYLLQFGKSPDKFIPKWLKNSDWRVIEEFLHWYCLGDGTFTECIKSSRGKKTVRLARKFYTISRRMADDLQEVMAKRGRQSVIAESVANDKPKFIITERVVQDKNFILPQHSKWIDYNGEIFCVTVPNHIVLVRRNGKIMWCGNSAYIGAFQKFADCPPETRCVNEAFSPILKQYGYRSMFCTEVRITKESESYFIDPTCRFPSPPSQCMCEMIGNLGEIIWQGANGILVEPEQVAKFGAQAIFKVDRDHWGVFQIPEEIDQFVKISFSCKSEGKICVPPDPQGVAEIGWCVGIGDTIEGAVDHLREVIDQMPEGVHVEFSSIADLMKELQAAKEVGIELTEQEIPDPSTVV